jgi:hypothetical protein
LTIHYDWNGVASMPPLRDGDRFTLTLEHEAGELELLNSEVQLETFHNCGGSCERTFIDLRLSSRSD